MAQPDIPEKAAISPCWQYLGILIFLWAGSAAANEPITITSPEFREPIARNIEVLEDETGNLSIDELLTHKTHRAFYNTNVETFNFGHNTSAFWFRIPINNRTKHELYLTLEINFPLLDDIRFFAPNDAGKFTKLHLGDTLPFNQRIINNRNFQIPFHLKAGDHKTYYLRIKSKGTIFIPIYLSSGTTLTQHAFSQELLLGGFYGIIIGFFIYNLFLLIATKEKIYLWYIIFSLSCASAMLSLDGLAFLLLPNLVTLQQVGIYLSVFTSLAASYQLTRHYLTIIDDHLPLDTLLQYGTRLVLFLLIATPFTPIALIAPVASFTLFISALIFLCCGITRWYQGFKPAIYFNIAWSIGVVTSLLLSFSAQGLFNFHDIGNNILKLGIGLAVISISLGLADRISRLKEEQFQLKKSELDAITESQAKSNFMAKMSHEIRTPMNGVLGITRLLMESGLTPAQARYTNIILNSGRSLLHIIDDILDHSKIESGHMVMESSEFNLQELTDDCMSIFTLKCHEENLVFFSSIPSDIPTNLIGDANRIKQVLVNLLSNATKFTHEGETSLYITKLSESDNSVSLNFSVHDTGIGISSEIQHKLFKSFQQEDNSTSRLYGGSGLGLTISKELVQLMGGELEFSSTKGQGSTFYFTIKLQRSEQPTAEAIVEHSILFADTSIQYAETLADQIIPFGYKSDFVINGQHLNEQLRIRKNNNAPYDFIIIDSNLENLSEIDENLLESFQSHTKILGMLALNQDLKDSDFPFSLTKHIEKPTSAYQLSQQLIDQNTITQKVKLIDQDEGDISRIFSHANILVAEDNKVNQTVIKGMLKKLGIAAEVVDNGQSALDHYINSDLQYDIVLMDCEMPVLDGYAAASKIRDYEDQHSQPHTPIIALTAHVLPEHKINSKRSGMNDHLSKPVDISTLKEKLITYLK